MAQQKHKYKLSYFGVRGIGEPIRFILSYLGLEFEDKRYNYPSEEWSKDKPSLPWASLPVLQEDDIYLAQSISISRYLGQKYNLAGANLLEATRINEYIDAIKDMYLETYPIYLDDGKDAEKLKQIKAKLENETAPKFIPKIERDIKANGGKFLVGNSVSWGDFVLAHYLFQMKGTIGSHIYDKYPGIEVYMEGIFNIPQIKAWISTRPDTPL